MSRKQLKKKQEDEYDSDESQEESGSDYESEHDSDQESEHDSDQDSGSEEEVRRPRQSRSAEPDDMIRGLRLNDSPINEVAIEQEKVKVMAATISKILENETRSAEFTFVASITPKDQTGGHVLTLGDGIKLFKASHPEDFKSGVDVYGFITTLCLKEYHNHFPKTVALDFTFTNGKDRTDHAFFTEYTLLGKSDMNNGKKKVNLIKPSVDGFALHFNTTYPGYTIENLATRGVQNFDNEMVTVQYSQEGDIGRHPVIDEWNNMAKKDRMTKPHVKGKVFMEKEAFKTLHARLINRLKNSTPITDISKASIVVRPVNHKKAVGDGELAWDSPDEIVLPIEKHAVQGIMNKPYVVSGRYKILYLNVKKLTK